MIEELFLKTLPNLGVGIAAVAVLYLVFRTAIEALNRRDEAFQKFVEANNHKSIEVMTECRDAIREAAENIRTSTEIQKQAVEHLIKDKN